MTIFDHLANITYKKVPWKDLSDADRKSFTPYLINRWLSMNPDYIDIVDQLQRYTIGLLDTKYVYQLYFDILPKQKTYSKYVKGKKSAKFNKDLVKLIANHFNVSTSEAETYIQLYMQLNKEELIDIIRKYGKSDKEIKQLIKTKK